MRGRSSVGVPFRRRTPLYESGISWRSLAQGGSARSKGQPHYIVLSVAVQRMVMGKCRRVTVAEGE